VERVVEEQTQAKKKQPKPKPKPKNQNKKIRYGGKEGKRELFTS
jgi:hypothetical protein